jgi:hypothetical protein
MKSLMNTPQGNVRNAFHWPRGERMSGQMYKPLADVRNATHASANNNLCPTGAEVKR